MTQAEEKIIKEIYGFRSGSTIHSGKGFCSFMKTRKIMMMAALKLEAAGLVVLVPSLTSKCMVAAMSPAFAEERGELKTARKTKGARS